MVNSLNAKSEFSMARVGLAPILAVLFFDCTGWLGFREVTFFLLFFIAIFCGFNRERKLDIFEICAVFGFVLSLFPGYFSSALNGVSLFNMLSFGLHPFSILFSFLIVKNLRIGMEHLTDAAWVVCGLVLLLHFDALMNVNMFSGLRDYLSGIPDAGFFNVKNAWGFKSVETYFKFTLYLVPVAVYCYYRKSLALYTLIIVVLFVAPSRAGLIIALMPFLFRHYLIGIPIVFCVLMLTLTNLDSLVTLVLSFQARLYHFSDISGIFNADVIIFFFGSGPGSAFYSTGLGGFAFDNEISYLELVRRYGILTFLVFALLALTYFLNLKCRAAKFALLGYLIVAASNPIIFTVFGLFILNVISNGSVLRRSNREEVV